MFTGIVQSLGRVASQEGPLLVIEPGQGFEAEGLRTGESIAVNGACLTVIGDESGPMLHFEVSPETFARTSLGCLSVGDPVNLERAMAVTGRLGGHIVQGHVDATGVFESRRSEGEFEVLRFRVPPEFDRYLIDKGSIAIDGVSLTVVQPEQGAFDVWAIPHTLANTNLGSLSEGAKVNLEFDVLAKYVEKLVMSQLASLGPTHAASLAPDSPASLPSNT
jgi:riboflavin synthase